MAPVNGGKTILGLEINLILFYVGVAGECVVSVSQTAYLEVDYTYEAVTMECSFSATGCQSEPPTSLWFRYRANQAEKLYLGGPKIKVEMALEKRYVSLTVNRVTLNDSGIYICGIAYSSSDSKAKQTGAGTMLVVRETKVLSVEMKSLLAALLFLLSLYIIGVAVVFIVLSKETPPAGESKSNSLGKKETEDSLKKKSVRRIFQEIAQELYNKRHVETNQQPEKDNTYENRSALTNYEKP